MDVAGGFVLVAALVAVLYLAGVGAGWVNAWWRRRQHDKAMDRVSARLRCTWWPCQRSVLGDQRCRRCRSGVAP